MTWSRYEIEEKAQQVFDRIEDELDVMKALSEAAAQAKSVFELAEAKLLLQVRADEELRATLTSDVLRKAYVRMTLGDLEFAYDVADAVWRSQVKVVNMLDTQAGLLRSLMRSSRDYEDTSGGWGHGEPPGR